jgi:two-component system response regulator
MSGQPIVLETRVSAQITIKTVQQNCYVSYLCQPGDSEIVDYYSDEISARAGHLKWTRKDWRSWDLSSQRKLRLLLAEDNPDDIKIARRAFEKPPATWEMAWVEDGQAALDFLYKRGLYTQAWTPDLFLLSINMPKLSGYEVLEAIKKDPVLSKIPVVMWTISLREYSIERCYSLGAAAYLSKGYSLGDGVRDLLALRDFWERVRFFTRLK